MTGYSQLSLVAKREAANTPHMPHPRWTGMASTTSSICSNVVVEGRRFEAKCFRDSAIVASSTLWRGHRRTKGRIETRLDLVPIRVAVDGKTNGHGSSEHCMGMYVVPKMTHLEHHERLGAVRVHEARDDSDDQGPLGLAGGAPGGDADETGEETVVGGSSVPVVHVELAEEDGGEGAGGSRDGGGRHGLGGDVGRAADRQGGGAVKPEPPEPEDQRAERLEHGGLLGEGVGATIFVEAADAGPDDLRGTERGDAAGHVHDARPGEVDHTAVEQEVRHRGEGGGPSPSGPAPVHDDGVDEGGQDDRVDDVGVEGHALGDGSGHDGGGGGGERPLEQPERVGVAVGEGPSLLVLEEGALEGEGGRSDKASC